MHGWRRTDGKHHSRVIQQFNKNSNTATQHLSVDDIRVKTDTCTTYIRLHWLQIEQCWIHFSTLRRHRRYIQLLETEYNQLALQLLTSWHLTDTTDTSTTILVQICVNVPLRTVSAMIVTSCVSVSMALICTCMRNALKQIICNQWVFHIRCFWCHAVWKFVRNKLASCSICQAIVKAPARLTI